jgi:hypothetical protein
MPLEEKHIYFSEPELRKSLVSFSKLRHQYFDQFEIENSIISDNDGSKVTLLVDKTLEFDDDKITYSNAEVAAALLAFCMVAKIPIPKAGTKELLVNDNKLYLKICLEQEVAFEEYVISKSISWAFEADKKFTKNTKNANFLNIWNSIFFE